MTGVACLKLNEWLDRLKVSHGGEELIDVYLHRLIFNCRKLDGLLKLPYLDDPSTNDGLARSAANLRTAASELFERSDDENVQLAVKRLHSALRAIVKTVGEKG